MSGGYRDAFDRAIALLKVNRPIAFALRLSQITGHPKDALLLSQLVYWTRRGRDVENTLGWIHKTRTAWQVETALTREEQENARRRLRRLRLIEEHRGGQPARLFYRLDTLTLSAELDRVTAGRMPIQLSFEFMRNHDFAMREVLGPTTAFHRVLVDVTGGVNAALLLSRMIQLQRHALESNELWFTVTAREWKRDLGLNRRQLENAKHSLRELGVIKEIQVHRRCKRLYSQIEPHCLLVSLEPVIGRQLGEEGRGRAAGGRDVAAPVEPRGNGSSIVKVNTVRRLNTSDGVVSRREFRRSNAQNTPTGSLPGHLLVGGKDAWQSEGLVHSGKRLSCIPNARTYTTTNTNTPTTTEGLTRLRGDRAPAALLAADATGMAAERSASLEGGDTCGTEPRQYGKSSVQMLNTTEVARHSLASPLEQGEHVALEWPDFVTAAERVAVMRQLVNLPPLDRQLIVDEMAGTHRDQIVRHPVAYVGALLERYRTGTFVPCKAYRERERRERRILAAVRAREQEARFAAGLAQGSNATPEAGLGPSSTKGTEPCEGRAALSNLLDDLRRRWLPTHSTTIHARSQGPSRPPIHVNPSTVDASSSRLVYGPGGQDGNSVPPETR